MRAPVLAKQYVILVSVLFSKRTTNFRIKFEFHRMFCFANRRIDFPRIQPTAGFFVSKRKADLHVDMVEKRFGCLVRGEGCVSHISAVSL